MHEWHLFTKGILTMPPGRKMTFLFDLGSRRFDSNLDMQFTFVVEAEGPFGPAPTLTYEVDLDSMRDSWVGHTTIKNLVDSLNKTNGGIVELTRAVQQLKPHGADE